MYNLPKVSIITVCYNSEQYIETSILSVLNQTYPNIEYIIIDGTSTDATLKIIQKYKDKIAKFISEKDFGIYDAMNKGIAQSSGELFYFLNTDDKLCNNLIIETIVNEFNKNGKPDILMGKVIPINVPKEFPIESYNQAFIKELKTKNDFLEYNICQQRLLIHKHILDKVGFFNNRYKICGDLDWILRAFNKGVNIKFIPIDIAFYNFLGVSYYKNRLGTYEKILIVFKNCTPVEFRHYFRLVFMKIIRTLFFNFRKDILFKRNSL